MKERVKKLLNYLGLDQNAEVKMTEYENICIVDNKEYEILTGEEANMAHQAYIESFLDDCGIGGFAKFAQDYILKNCVNTEWFDDAMQESYESYVFDIGQEMSNSTDFETRLEEEMAEADCEDEDSYVEYLCSQYDNGMEWYKENFGESEFSEAVKNYCSVDIAKVSKYCIRYDGRAHSLATYDGHELELGDNYYAYRLN